MPELTTRRKILKARGFTEDLGDGVTLPMTEIPAGQFWMGTPDDEIERLRKEYKQEYFRRESPQHLVTISRFFMGRCPITQDQYQKIMGENPSNFTYDFEQSGDVLQRPVEQVSWLKAKEFCQKLSEATGKPYRLSTEAEWEYACRSVILPSAQPEKIITQEEWNEKYNYTFHFGETINAEYANYDGTEVYGKGSKGKQRMQTTLVGYFKIANNFGLFDMHGNVLEWCEDDYHNNYESAPTDGSAWVNESNEIAGKVLRGGSWKHGSSTCNSTFRHFNSRNAINSSFGFRVVVSP